LGLERGENDHTSQKFTVTDPWRKPSPICGCRASKEEEKKSKLNTSVFFYIYISQNSK
jgi:hypothetical protein